MFESLSKKMRLFVKDLLGQGGLNEFASFIAHEITPEERATLAATPLGRIFVEHDGRTIHKWIHFFAVYERYFGSYVGTDFKFLEIGISMGGSIEMWRKYFGQAAVIYGIDVDPACADRVSPPNQARIGSQDDPKFLTSVAGELGAIDVVLDDGSHVGRHQQKSFEVLWPFVKEGGLYVIEDTHTSYWSRWEGGFRRKGSAIEIGKDVVDDQHGWYHRGGQRFVAMDQVGAVHFHDSIIVIEKARISRPKTVHMPVTPA